MELLFLLVVFAIYTHAKSVGMVGGYEQNQNENNKIWRNELS